MGLDQFAYSSTLKISVDESLPDSDATEIHYWRKHPNLQGWMEELWRKKGGVGVFNGQFVEVTDEDLAHLELDVLMDQLPQTTGFFFGVSCAEDRESDQEFIQEARKELAQGRHVYYTSWW